MARVAPSTEAHEGALRKMGEKEDLEGDDGVDGGLMASTAPNGGVDWW